MSEIVALFDAAHKRFNQYPQDMYCLMVSFATAGRLIAICELHTDWCLDYKLNLLIMNNPARMQTRKFRPTIRHTATTILFEKNAPEMEVELYTGHSSGRSASRRHYFKYHPDYHQQEKLVMESFFDELSKHTKAHLRNTNETRDNIEIDANELYIAKTS